MAARRASIRRRYPFQQIENQSDRPRAIHIDRTGEVRGIGWLRATSGLY